MPQQPPSVGPVQGLQTAPSSRPTPNCPNRPVGANPPNFSCANVPTGPAAVAKRICSAGSSSTMPMRISRTAAAFWNTSLPTPAAKPIVATKMPIAANDTATPAASATGPSLCSETAVASTIGTSGSTHGASIDRMPATKAKRTLGRCMAQLAALANRAEIEPLSVSPVERPTSWGPL